MKRQGFTPDLLVPPRASGGPRRLRAIIVSEASELEKVEQVILSQHGAHCEPAEHDDLGARRTRAPKSSTQLQVRGLTARGQKVKTVRATSRRGALGLLWLGMMGLMPGESARAEPTDSAGDTAAWIAIVTIANNFIVAAVWYQRSTDHVKALSKYDEPQILKNDDDRTWKSASSREAATQSGRARHHNGYGYSHHSRQPQLHRPIRHHPYSSRLGDTTKEPREPPRAHFRGIALPEAYVPR